MIKWPHTFLLCIIVPPKSESLSFVFHLSEDSWDGLLYQGPHRDGHGHGSALPLHKGSVYPLELGGGKTSFQALPRREGGAIPSCQTSAIHTWSISEYTVSFLSLSSEKGKCELGSDKWVFERKSETNITWTVPAGVTSSRQRAPVPTCSKALYTCDLPSWQPHKAGTLLSPFDDGRTWVSGLFKSLGQDQWGCLIPKPELSICPEIFGEKPEENLDLHCGHLLETGR